MLNMRQKGFQRRTFLWAGLLMGLAGWWAGAAWAADETASSTPWEKFNVSLGGFYSNTQSSVRVGGGLGVDLDLEKALDIKRDSTVFRAESGWRFSDNRRHRVDLSWFALHRTATRTIGQDFDITRPNGSTTTISAGSDVTSHFNLDILSADYGYSFLQDDRVDLELLAGLYVMPIHFDLSTRGAVVTEGKLAFTAPLPVLGYRMDFALTPKWFFRSQSQFFYVKYQSFTGKLVEMRGAVEYLPIKHVGVGLGVDTFNAALEAQGKDYPNVDLSGRVQLAYTGLQFYAKYFF